MGLNIILRSSTAVSPFRRYLRALLAIENLSEIVLCSGYFQEELWGYAVYDDDLKAVVEAHPKKSTLQFTVIAGKFNRDSESGAPCGLWFTGFCRFLSALSASGVNVQAYVAKDKNWHAKIALFIEDGCPVAGIIGSSNFTRPAVDEPGVTSRPFTNWNFECDVVLWKPYGRFQALFEDAVPNRERDSVFSPILAQLKQGQPKEDARLAGLYREIKNRKKLEQFDDWRNKG